MVPITTTTDFNADFYVATATIIPVVFLALAIEGGLWEWISGRIKTGGIPTVPARAFVSLLQLFAVLVIFAATLSEVLALFCLWQKYDNKITGSIVFLSTVLLVLLLGLVLAARIPGVFIIQGSNALEIELEDDEEILHWSASCTKLAIAPLPYWVWGKLFITDKRIVWMTSRELGLFAAATIEIRAGVRTVVSTKPRSARLTKFLMSNSLPPGPPKGYFFDLITLTEKTHHLCAYIRSEEVSKLLDSLSRVDAVVITTEESFTD